MKERQGGCPTARIDVRESSEHIGPEACEVIIVMLQRDPSRSKRSVLQPGREEGRLAKAGRGGDEGERALDAKLELVHETWTRNQIGTDRGLGEFRDQEQLLARATFRVPRWQGASWVRGILHLFFSLTLRDMDSKTVTGQCLPYHTAKLFC